MALTAGLRRPHEVASTQEPRPDARRRRQRRTKLVTGARWFALCIGPLSGLLLYVALMAGLTAQTYTLGAQQHLHAQLTERNSALRSRVAQLESVGRLEAAARQLHMGEPATVAVIAAPVTGHPQERRTALLERLIYMRRWLSAR